MLDFLWTLLVAAGVILGIPASIVTLVPPWRKQVWGRFREWRYKRSNRYRIDQLEKQIHNLPAQMDAYHKELEQVDAARWELLHEVARLHQSSEHPDNLTTTEELSEQIKATQAQYTDLQGTMVQAFWQMLKIQTNTNNYYDNHSTLEEFMELLNKWSAYPPEPEPDPEIKKLRATLNNLVETTRFLMGEYLRDHPEAVLNKQAAKERADTPD